jgi:transposase
MMSDYGVVALDIHRDFSKAVVMAPHCEIIGEERISHAKAEFMDRFFAGFPRGTGVVMEATFNWPWIADAAEARGLCPHLAHPPRAREFARGKSKSDRNDAIFLGRLRLSSAVFPAAYLAPPLVRGRRALLRQRILIVRLRTMLKNAVHGRLFKLGHRLSAEFSDLFGKAGRARLERLELPERERLLLDGKLAALDDLQRRICDLETAIHSELQEAPEAELLMSIPGVGKLTAYALLAEIGPISRFPNGRALAAYAGLLPLSNKSADRDHGSRCSGFCNHHLRWAALEAVCGAVRGSARFRSLHSRVKARNRNKAGKARVAVARELLEVAHLLLRRGVRYEENPEGRRERALAGSRPRPRTSDPNRASQRHLSARSRAGSQADK